MAESVTPEPTIMRTALGLATAPLVLVASILGAVTVARTRQAPVPPARLSDAHARDLDIEFYRSRVARDSLSARDYGELARLYLQRARETGDNDDLLRAESEARHSLSLRGSRNQATLQVLASTLMAQHRFVEARDAAAALVDYDSTSAAARSLLGETELELGEYAAAGRNLGMLRSYASNPGIAPRLARWEELQGRPREARRLLRLALQEASRRHEMPAEQLAWFHLRAGDLALRLGHTAEAEAEFKQGLERSPDDYRLLAALARLNWTRRRWTEAIEFGERSIAGALDPATLGMLHDAYSALGDTGRAEDYYRAMALAVLHQPGPFHRAWSLFLLDHDREIPAVLAKARAEIATRRDVYGYDLLAWALHKAGRDIEASRQMRHALGLGTRDASLFYHAGIIALALGNKTEARHDLEAALEINPFWHPWQPDHARHLLHDLSRRSLAAVGMTE
jgi:tetratricopeptide (TPR) repeat protein